MEFGPRYAEKSLKKALPDIECNDDHDLNIEYRDYTNMPGYENKDKYGVLILAYRDPLSVSIHYFENKQIVRFQIEIDSYEKIINVTYKYDELNEKIFKYFNLIIETWIEKYKIQTEQSNNFSKKSIPENIF